MRRLNLGDFCKECLCAECSRRKYCATMEGNTDWYCHNECEGQCGMMKQCSEFTPIKEGPDAGKEDDESDMKCRYDLSKRCTVNCEKIHTCAWMADKTRRKRLAAGPERKAAAPAGEERDNESDHEIPRK